MSVLQVLLSLRALFEIESRENLKKSKRIHIQCKGLQCLNKLLPFNRDYIGNNATHPINVDSRAVELVNERMKSPNHFTFDPAQV